MKGFYSLAWLLCVWGTVLCGKTAADVVFPADAGVVDLTRSPFFARGDGKTDDTQAIQKALDEYTGRNVILYLPKGTYLISRSLRLPLKNPKGDTNWGGFHLQGQSREGTVLRLKDGTFTDPAHPAAVLDSGPHSSADWFHNDVRNLTFSIGRRNPGAIGLRFYSNNTGAVRDVNLRSEDGAGKVGLDLAYNDMNGPLLVKNLYVRGFEVGVACGHTVNSQTFSHVRLKGQRKAGIVNDGQYLAIENLVSVNQVPSLLHNSGLIALIGARLKSSSPSAALLNRADLYARDVRVDSNGPAIRSSDRDIAGPRVSEFISAPILRLFPSPPHALRLPIRQTPSIPEDDPTTWASPVHYGVKPDAEADAAPALQAAIDSGATTVYLPNGHYRIGQTVVLRGKVRRIMGCESILEPISPLMKRGDPLFRLEKTAAPVVMVERLSTTFEGGPFRFIEHDSAGALIMSDLAINFQGADTYRNLPGAGPLYVENVVGGPFHFTRQSVWARQLNQESEGPHLSNEGGQLWILGLKTERGGTLVETKSGGKTEILGGLCYTTTSGKLAPMFVNDRSAVTVTLGERSYNGDPYLTILSESRDGTIRTMPGTDPGYRGRIVLYTGYTPTDKRAVHREKIH